jgi:GntR family transcriptional regulator
MSVQEGAPGEFHTLRTATNRIDPASPRPLYLQIVDVLRGEIASGLFGPGERLPTIREVAARLDVHRNTAARAFRHLESEGWIHTRVGQGTVVRGDRPTMDRARGEPLVDRHIDRLLVEAQAAGIPLEELGWRLSRRIEELRRRRS